MYENINSRRKWIIIGWALGIAVAWAIAGGIGGFVGEKYALQKLFQHSVEDSEGFPSAG